MFSISKSRLSTGLLLIKTGIETGKIDAALSICNQMLEQVTRIEMECEIEEKSHGKEGQA